MSINIAPPCGVLSAEYLKVDILVWLAFDRTFFEEPIVISFRWIEWSGVAAIGQFIDEDPIANRS